MPVLLTDIIRYAYFVKEIISVLIPKFFMSSGDICLDGQNTSCHCILLHLDFSSDTLVIYGIESTCIPN